MGVGVTSPSLVLIVGFICGRITFPSESEPPEGPDCINVTIVTNASFEAKRPHLLAVAERDNLELEACCFLLVFILTITIVALCRQCCAPAPRRLQGKIVRLPRV